MLTDTVANWSDMWHIWSSQARMNIAFKCTRFRLVMVDKHACAGRLFAAVSIWLKTLPHFISACAQYNWLNGSDRRYDHYDSSSKCDDSNIAKKWYRFGGGAGSQMYTSCLSYYYCRAHYPGYMSSSHPAYGEGIVSRTVYFGYSGYTCYYTSTTIRVLNCGTYYVYELVATGSCYQRYCST